jgi:hypothetical protein
VNLDLSKLVVRIKLLHPDSPDQFIRVADLQELLLAPLLGKLLAFLLCIPGAYLALNDISIYKLT